MSPDTARVVATQTERLVRFVREHPGASVMEITLGLSPFVSNPRARMSDARKHGYVFASWRDDTGVMRFRVREPGQQELGLVAS